jgi:hypothetical protein
MGDGILEFEGALMALITDPAFVGAHLGVTAIAQLCRLRGLGVEAGRR